MSKKTWGLVLLLTGFFIELAFQTFWRNELGIRISPLVELAGGLLTCAGGFLLLRPSPAVATTAPKRWNWAPALALLTITGILLGAQLSQIFEQFPIKANASDIVPSIQLYVRRLLAGQEVYQPMNFGNWTVLPTYFPLMWLPYLPAEWLGVDYRWIPFVFFELVILIFLIRAYRRGQSWWEIALLVGLTQGAIWCFVQFEPSVFGFAVELTPVAYYLILALTLFHPKSWAMALGIAGPLLSRYAFTFWLPLVYGLLVWIERGFGRAFRMGLWTLAGVALFYLLPFWMRDPGILSRGLDYYNTTAISVWQTQPWQKKGATPHYFIQGVGLGIYFYEGVEGPVEKRLAVMRSWQLAACLVAALGLLASWWLYFRKKRIDPRLFLLVSLKFYLTVFYALLYVPFTYLYMVPLLVSLPVFWEVRKLGKTV